MSYYTERHNIRRPVEKTYEITPMKYDFLLNICKTYYDNIAWRFPKSGYVANCVGVDEEKLTLFFQYEMPDLYGLEFSTIGYAMDDWIFFSDHPDKFNGFAIFDLIEFIYANVRDVYSTMMDGGEADLQFGDSRYSRRGFRHEINRSFEKIGLLYILTDDGNVERLFDYGVIDDKVISDIDIVDEDGLKDLLKNAVEKHRSPFPKDIRDSVEKIWDALERLKTYYTDLDKKTSVAKIIKDISSNKEEFYLIFETEFKVLTEIGNKFRIRHHETNKIDITDIRHYDYFFDRCMSLISLSIKYLENKKYNNSTFIYEVK